MSNKQEITGLLAFGKEHCPGLEDAILLKAEADKTADRINAISEGKVRASAAEFDAELERLSAIMALMDAGPTVPGKAN